MILEVGRVCRKTRGRDAGSYCVVVDKADKNQVTIDGSNVRRKKTSIRHLEPLPVVLKIKKGAKKDEVAKALKKEGL
ncbi:MAG: 50S ribosomal protein L14e [Candidatus Altiarchaeales archaeon]|nr:50S ribosomal protein L14e [Candidatus Altiarchaeota archaeon]MBU4341590.1 50S ribosomal protein L14e [Candidatus Altiarchaeota archaeon]MBU4406986.1 50S ribosomal protein L14e [Candidatus Altiarchaeota archaeon]MBU4437402.1 50S ribosomal protein L14e [Candidatus Altiarchaeota archaeon]MCG2782471.1 50S ribosomal protein L14e [Candidatus Altiarchaeales archaeon]